MHSVRITSTSFCTSTSVRRIELWLSGCCYCYTSAAKRQARCKRKPLPRRSHVYVGLRRSAHSYVAAKGLAGLRDHDGNGTPVVLCYKLL